MAPGKKQVRTLKKGRGKGLQPKGAPVRMRACACVCAQRRGRERLIRCLKKRRSEELSSAACPFMPLFILRLFVDPQCPFPVRALSLSRVFARPCDVWLSVLLSRRTPSAFLHFFPALPPLLFSRSFPFPVPALVPSFPSDSFSFLMPFPPTLFHAL